MGKQNELKKIGEIYRELRLDKGIKLSNYIDKGFSKSQLSRFERGETEISLIKFLSALDFINVSIEEFMVIYRGYRNDSFEELLKKLHTLSLTKDAEGLRYLFNEVEGLPNSTTKKIEKILILSCLSSVESENLITQSDLRFVTDYLFGIESWGYYELSILGNLAQYINGETLVSLGREVLRKTDYYYEVVRNRKLVIQLSINIMIRCIESEWFTKAAFFERHIDSLVNVESDMYEKVIFSYVQGYLKFAMGDSGGKQIMQESLEIFKLLKNTRLYKNYLEHFKSIVG